MRLVGGARLDPEEGLVRDLITSLSSASTELSQRQKEYLREVDAAVSRSDFQRAKLYLDAVEHVIGLIELARSLKAVGSRAVPRDSKVRTALSISIGTMSLSAWQRRLFPPEAMLCLSGPACHGEFFHLDQAVSLKPDTSSSVHFQPTPESIYSALKRFERFGYGLRAIIHSHPGEGPSATTPSATDRQTLEKLERSYRAIGMVATRDGYLRAFSHNLEFALSFFGEGIEIIDENERLYKLNADDSPACGQQSI